MSKTDLAYKKNPSNDAEYLRIERQAFEKSELIGGEVVAMAGASDNHNVISSNLMIEIGIQTKKTTCRPFSSDMRVKAKKGNYYYPDIVVVCGDRKYEDNKKDSLLNPKIVIEVLSKSTRLKDRNEKLDSYMSLEGLTDYVLVEQTTMRIEHFIKINEKEWRVRLLTEKDEKLILESINCEVTLDEIYREIKFSK
ncbi:MAG TPA: Uma2 family endonuclease [Pyrinomonadaceae bacterium]|nr:Uma2 family endonuclease [Pyrinomonadaceae bacterium]